MVNLRVLENIAIFSRATLENELIHMISYMLIDSETLMILTSLPPHYLLIDFSCLLTSSPRLRGVYVKRITIIKNHVIKYCEKVYERSGKNLFWSIKNSCEVLNKLKSRGFRASSLSTYDFSTLYTTLPHNLIKDKLADLIERTFQSER